jgi:heme/copper-type cytochrome/quinol oxidase subunit 2
MADSSEHNPDLGMGLEHFHASPRLELAVTIVVIILVVVAVITVCVWCFREIARRRSSALKRKMVHPVPEDTFNAATTAPAQAALDV